MTLKIKSFDFEINTRSKSFSSYVKTESELIEIARDLLHTPALPEKPVRLLGLTVSNLEPTEGSNKSAQLRLDL